MTIPAMTKEEYNYNIGKVDFTNFLRAHTLARRTFHGKELPSGLKYYCLEEFVLRHGYFFNQRRAPSKKLAFKQCFQNAFNLARRTQRGSNLSRHLFYCEGYAYIPGLIPVHHAWCVDLQGRVVDTTWDDWDKAIYGGIILPPKFINEHIDLWKKCGNFLDLWESNLETLRGELCILGRERPTDFSWLIGDPIFIGDLWTVEQWKRYMSKNLDPRNCPISQKLIFSSNAGTNALNWIEPLLGRWERRNGIQHS